MTSVPLLKRFVYMYVILSKTHSLSVHLATVLCSCLSALGACRGTFSKLGYFS